MRLLGFFLSACLCETFEVLRISTQAVQTGTPKGPEHHTHTHVCCAP